MTTSARSECKQTRLHHISPLLSNFFSNHFSQQLAYSSNPWVLKATLRQPNRCSSATHWLPCHSPALHRYAAGQVGWLQRQPLDEAGPHSARCWLWPKAPEQKNKQKLHTTFEKMNLLHQVCWGKKLQVRKWCGMSLQHLGTWRLVKGLQVRAKLLLLTLGQCGNARKGGGTLNGGEASLVAARPLTPSRTSGNLKSSDYQMQISQQKSN